MPLIFFLAGLALGGDYDGKIYTYRIHTELETDMEWMVEASNGLFLCKATVPCVGLDEPSEIKTYRPTWHAPLRIYYWDKEILRYCELKSCEREKQLHYSDL